MLEKIGHRITDLERIEGVSCVRNEGGDQCIYINGIRYRLLEAKFLVFPEVRPHVKNVDVIGRALTSSSVFF